MLASAAVASRAWRTWPMVGVMRHGRSDGDGEVVRPEAAVWPFGAAVVALGCTWQFVCPEAGCKGSDGSANGASGGGSSSSLSVCTSLFLEFLPFSLGSSYIGLRRQLVSEGSLEPQTTDTTPSSSRLSFSQNWQGGRWMAGWRRPGLVPRGFSDLDSFC